MLEQIIKEKISSDHLLYVSLKYTKTCDVILNLLRRWSIMIEHAVEGLLTLAKKNKKIKMIPLAPRQKTELLKVTFKKEEKVLNAIELYELFKRIDKLPKTRENEFRKGVRIKAQDQGKEVIIDLEKLKEYAQILEDFINFTKQYLQS